MPLHQLSVVRFQDKITKSIEVEEEEVAVVAEGEEEANIITIDKAVMLKASNKTEKVEEAAEVAVVDTEEEEVISVVTTKEKVLSIGQETEAVEDTEGTEEGLLATATTSTGRITLSSRFLRPGAKLTCKPQYRQVLVSKQGLPLRSNNNSNNNNEAR